MEDALEQEMEEMPLCEDLNDQHKPSLALDIKNKKDNISTQV